MKGRIILTNLDIQNKATNLITRIRAALPNKNEISVFGVPRGGIPVIYILKSFGRIKIVDDPANADVIIDDIVDSGKTRNHYITQYPYTPFLALYEHSENWLCFPWEGSATGSADDIPTRFIEYIGEDAGRDGLKDTPARVIRSWDELYSGYKTDPKSVITVFDNEEHYDEMVTLAGVEMYSTCEHHLLPFFGKVTISYIPSGKVIGISKLSRIVDIFSRRLQIQERLTMQIANFIEDALSPVGVGVMIKAQHLCMIARGVKQSEAFMVTTALKGIMKEDSKARSEFLNMCK